ncbi:MAG: SDR family NAD(P)-dependent oxidoreductase [bacterium]|nr:SDR family NAD(P)-dependent oxidoreductase [bacterium]
MEDKRVLVTGGAGFIGSNLVDELAKKNDVVVIDDFSSGNRENLKQHENSSNVKIIEADIRDKGKMFEYTRGVDVLFNLAVRCLRISIHDPEVNNEVNATGTLNLLLAAMENNIDRFVYCSTSEVYGTAKTIPMGEDHPKEPLTVYGASKLAGELYAKAFHNVHGYPAMVVRPFNTYGPREHFEGPYGEVIPKFFVRVLNDEVPIIFGNGEQTRDFTFVSDTVKGMIMAAECDDLLGEAVNVACGQEVSIKTIAELVIKTAGKKNIEPRYEKDRPGDVMRHYADVSKAEKMFGFKPQVSIEEGIEKFFQWFSEEYPDVTECFKQDVIFNWEK